MDGQITLTLLALAWLAWSLFAAIFWPFVRCPAPFCHRGKVARPGRGRGYRRCSWCRGSGERIRWARRLFDAVQPQRRSRARTGRR